MPCRRHVAYGVDDHAAAIAADRGERDGIGPEARNEAGDS